MKDLLQDRDIQEHRHKQLPELLHILQMVLHVRLITLVVQIQMDIILRITPEITELQAECRQRREPVQLVQVLQHLVEQHVRLRHIPVAERSHQAVLPELCQHVLLIPQVQPLHVVRIRAVVQHLHPLLHQAEVVIRVAVRRDLLQDPVTLRLHLPHPPLLQDHIREVAVVPRRLPLLRVEEVVQVADDKQETDS